MTLNLLVMIHGITVEPEPRDHRAAYDALWAALQREQPRLSVALPTPLGLEWGHEPPWVARQAQTRPTAHSRRELYQRANELRRTQNRPQPLRPPARGRTRTDSTSATSLRGGCCARTSSRRSRKKCWCAALPTCFTTARQTGKAPFAGQCTASF